MVSCGTTTWCVAFSRTYLLVSFDGESSWSAFPLPRPVFSLSCLPSGTCLGVSRRGQVLLGSDFGESWRTIWIETSIPAFAYLDAIDCSSSEDCVMSDSLDEVAGDHSCSPYCRAGMLLTKNGGRTWSTASMFGRGGPGTGATSIACPSESFCVAASGLVPNLVGTQFEITADGGREWRQLRTASVRPPVYPGAVACSSAESCIFVAGNDGLPPSMLIARTVDQGRAWQLASLPAVR